MIVAAALCASPPLLHPALTGRDVVLPELRAACAEAVARLLGEDPETVVVVGPAVATGEWEPDGVLDSTAFAPGAASGGSGRGSLPLSLGLGAMLLDQAGYRGPRRLLAVSADEVTSACAALGAELAVGATRMAMLVMGDGSARRSLKAPGHLDPRAEPFDAQVEQAVRDGRPGALLKLDEALARDLMATGRPAWQVLAGAIPNDALVTEVLYRDDPFGVAYLVASLHPRARS
ncbi:MAG: hypothetical protein ABSB59_31640 [Streptosporangiaceae bacterium]